ncbi:MAG: PqqD family protein [Paludibacteraceae bacterium]|nr:PqqD family protein [Paludibacteraceae bacterium]
MKIKSGFRLRPLGNEFILVGEGIEQINFNKMITMNETAAYLWRKAAEVSFFDEKMLATWLTDEYDVSLDQALQDTANTLSSWQNAGIIE